VSSRRARPGASRFVAQERTDLRVSGRVEIAGAIAAGKTTLAKALRTVDLHVVRERFRDSLYWRAFFRDPRRYAFEAELGFLVDHYHLCIAAAEMHDQLVCDYSIAMDFAYADVTMDGPARRVFTRVAREVTARLGEPRLVVHLACSPSVLLERIRRRGRKTEVTIDLGFLEALDRALTRRVRAVRSAGVRVLVIDSAKTDFRPHGRDLESVRKEVARLV
jgi:deoxyguanosine kinase